MRRHVHLACLLVALAAPALPGVAHADDASVAEAKTRFEEGLTLADAGKHEAARVKFQQAWAVMKAPAVLYNLARSEQLTGNDVDALDHFRLFLRIGADDAKITDAMRDKAKDNVAVLATKTAQIEVEVASTARVAIDGKPIEFRPREPVPVRPGRHTVEATFEGRLKSITVECAAGHVARATLDFDTSGGSTYAPPDEDRKQGAGALAVPIALGVAGLTGIGLGIGFAIASQNSRRDYVDVREKNPGVCGDPTSGVCADYNTKRDDTESAATVSKVAYVAGGVLVLGAAVTAIVLWPKSREKTATAKRAGLSRESVHPLIGNGTLGLGFGGRF